MLNGFRFMGSEARKNCLATDIYWGIVAAYVTFKVMGMDEIT